MRGERERERRPKRNIHRIGREENGERINERRGADE